MVWWKLAEQALPSTSISDVCFFDESFAKGIYCLLLCFDIKSNHNLLLTKHEGRTGEYWREVVFPRTARAS